jgi:hypothetical protein
LDVHELLSQRKVESGRFSAENVRAGRLLRRHDDGGAWGFKAQKFFGSFFQKRTFFLG